MFHFPSFPPHALCVQARVTGDESSRVSPFGNPRITVRLPTPRGLSQAPTSFIGSWCQGIHRMPLKTWLQISKMLASTVQFSRYGRSRSPVPAPGCWRAAGSSAGSIRARGGLMPVPSGPNSVPRQSLTVSSVFRVDPREDPFVLRRFASATANWSMFHP